VGQYTTDRNACALVLDEIGGEGVTEMLFVSTLLHELNMATSAFSDGCHGLLKFRLFDFIRRANPDTICYCAVKAVTDGKS